MPEFKVGDRVDRIEEREVTGATIIDIMENTDDYKQTCVELEYDEGGKGWWPINYIKLIE